MEHNIAVLIDFENIAAGVEKESLGRLDVGIIMNRVREKGRILVARSYADWGRFSRFKKDLLFEGVTLMELSAHGHNDKNRADVAMVVDAMELALTKTYVDTFVVISGDSDFTPLIVKLKELNKRVLGCGTRKSTSRLIIEACDEFFFYDTLRKQKTQRTRRGRDENESNVLSREEAMELVTEALVSLQRDDPSPVHASKIKEAVLRKEPTFDEADLGFSSITRFLEACAREGVIRLERDPRGGGVLVDTPDGTPEPGVRSEPPILELSGEAQRLYDLLAGEELEPLTRPLRTQICEQIVRDAEERGGRNRRMNLQWVTQGVARKLKAQDPRITPRRVRGVVNALYRAGVFVHSDGEPVRSFFASFTIKGDPRTLARKADVALLKRLQELGVELKTAAPDLAELLLGDRKRVRDIEELMAWELTPADPDAEVERKPVVAAPPRVVQAQATIDAEGEGEEEEDSEGRGGRRRRRRNRRGRGEGARGGEEDLVAEDSGAEQAPAEEAAEPMPAQAPVAAEAETAEQVVAEEEETAEQPPATEQGEAPAEAADAPRSRRTRRSSEEADEPAPAEQAPPAEDKPRRRRRVSRPKSEG